MDDRRESAEGTGPARVLFSAREAAREVGAKLEAWPHPAAAGGFGDTVITGVRADSRLIRPGDLFCAFPGERVDGHDFVGRAFLAGARAALVSRRPAAGGADPSGTGLLLVVPEVLAALAALARRHLRRFPVPVIGVTGSVGKTTTKDLIASALSPALPVLANRGNLNTEIGLPLTIFELGPEHRLACLEMGMRGPGEIARLAKLARPETAVLTNIDQVHLELLKSIEAIVSAKEELLWALGPEGSAVLNADDPLVAAMAERHRSRLRRVLTYGLVAPADVAGRMTGEATFEVVFSGAAREMADVERAGEFRLPAGGRHIAANAAAAVGCGLLYGVGIEAMREGLAGARLSPMRQEVVDVGGVTVIDDTYNAGPASVAAALEFLVEKARRRSGRPVALLGDMLELGPFTEEAHRETGRRAAALDLSLLVAVGPNSRLTAVEARRAGLPRASVHHVPTPDDAARVVVEAVRAGDVVLVKGSRGMRLEGAAKAIIEALGDREEERSDGVS